MDRLDNLQPEEWVFERSEENYLIFWHKVLNLVVIFKNPLLNGEENSKVKS